MNEVYLEVFFPLGTLEAAGFYGRDEVEDPLGEALEASKLGEVSGGGGGYKGSDVSVTIYREDTFEEALALIRRVLKEVGAPPETIIIRHKPQRIEYAPY